MPKKAFIANRADGARLCSTEASLSGSIIKREPSVTINASTGTLRTMKNSPLTVPPSGVKIDTIVGHQVFETMRWYEIADLFVYFSYRAL